MRSAIIALHFSIISSCAWAGGIEHSLLVVIDNSAALQGTAEAETWKRTLLYRLSELRKQRTWRDARVQIITTNNPRNVFVGSAKDLFKQGKLVLGSIATVKNGCADLTGALVEQIKLNLELERPKRTTVIVFSSLIHTGAPCDAMRISLPQSAPETLNLSFLKRSKVRFYWAHHLQVRPWVTAIRKSGLKDFRIYDEQTTRTELSKRRWTP